MIAGSSDASLLQELAVMRSRPGGGRLQAQLAVNQPWCQSHSMMALLGWDGSYGASECSHATGEIVPDMHMMHEFGG